jgi:bacteriophage HK97-gp10 putative tail-component
MFSVSIPIPSTDKSSEEELKKLLDSVKDAARQVPVRGGVISEGDAAAYALVWEWGNARQTKQGPKTVRSFNPDGEEVWLSIQAPQGYIRINEPEFVMILQKKLGEMDLSNWEEAQDILDAMKKASVEAANQIAEIIKETAPVASGALRDSIGPADPNDPDLAVDDEELELGVGFAHHMFIRTIRDQNE